MRNVSEMVANGELIGSVVDVNEILEVIRGRWGDLDDECGCYVNGNWLSIADIANLIVEYAYSA